MSPQHKPDPGPDVRGHFLTGSRLPQSQSNPVRSSFTRMLLPVVVGFGYLLIVWNWITPRLISAIEHQSSFSGVCLVWMVATASLYLPVIVALIVYHNSFFHRRPGQKTFDWLVQAGCKAGLIGISIAIPTAVGVVLLWLQSLQ
ncbi:MAG TPA: hypothetical protein PL157_23930 [Acidobacteriota bacterium]|nr:hypothetical protein [Acidobacteriota bacterium]